MKIRMVSNQKIKIILPADLNFSSILRTVAEGFFNTAGFSQSWANRLKLVVDELFMNAVRYGSSVPASEVHLTFFLEDETVRVQVDDDGTGENKMTPQDLQARIDQNKANHNVTKTSGRGLAMISHFWTDRFWVQASTLGGLSVSFIKKIEITAPPTPPSVALPVVDPIKSSTSVMPGSIVTVALRGDIDQNTIDSIATSVQKQIAELPQGSTLIFDFEKVTYINSTFIGHLAEWYNEMKKKIGIIQLKNTNQAIRDVLSLVGLTHLFEVT